MDYVLGEVLYTGAETRVVTGMHRSSKAPVVLKLPRHELPEERIVARVRSEHALLCELDLPGVIKALDLVPYGAGVALVLERWGSSSLDRILARGPLPVEAVLHLGAALGRLLGELHRRGVLHRDIKPQNILVDAACADVRLIDFGVATLHGAAVEPASEGALTGTLAYMAPEQTGRMKRSVDARADLYALGGTLYQMLTGQVPFEMTEELELIHAHIARRPLPPGKRAPEQGIPEAVSAIVMKLLEKSPEQRYQTGDGLAWDLERALGELREAGAIAPFALGTRDWEDRIQKPSRLFGREREQRALAGAFASARRGAVELLLVSGPSGVGKSALVGALREEVRAFKGLFASGKFDLLHRGTPYAAIAQAFQALARQRLGDSAEELARWEQIWRAALGPNARILADMVPELARILGELPALLEVSPTEARNRFQLTVQRFVRATASAEHPLVLFIDDLQWADASSLSLLEAIVTDPEVKYLLVVGAYRDNEVTAEHPLHALSRSIRKSMRRAQVHALGPLDEQALVQMVGDMLRGAGDEVRALGAVVKAKTDGSPFFVEQFLRALHERRLLWRDMSTGRFRWEAERIERAGVTDNVVELLTEKMGRLPAELRRTLAVGACVGASFEAPLLSAAAGLTPEALGGALEALVNTGLLVRAPEVDDEVYAFVHDRVQQSAYEMLGQDERLDAHLTLARVLDERWSAQGADAALFALLHHYLRAMGRLDDAAERRRVAERCLAAGQRAKAASAYAEATRFLRAGRELLVSGGESDPAELDFEIHLALAEASFLAGEPREGERLFSACREKAKDAVTRGRVAQVQVPLLTVAGRYPEGLSVGLAALEELGFAFPREPEALRAFFGAQAARIAPMIAAMSADAFRALPSCADPVARRAGELIGASITSAALGQPDLAPSLIFTMLEIALVHGLFPRAAYGLSMSAVVFTSVLEEHALSAWCVQMVFAARSIPGLLLSGALHTASLAAQFVHPDRALVHAQWRDIPDLGQREGAITHSEVSAVVLPAARMSAGDRLSSCSIPAKPWRDRIAGESATAYRAVHSLLTRVDTEDARKAICHIAALPFASPMGRLCMLGSGAFAAVHMGEDQEALQLAEEAAPIWTAGWCNPPILWSLTILSILGATLPRAEAEGDSARRAAFAVQRARLAKLAAFNPATFRRAMLLVEAGEARAAGQHDAAERLYNEAIEHARQQGSVNDEALGLRLCGEHLLSRGRGPMARAALREAHEAYLRWEAFGAAAALRRKYPDFFPEGELTAIAPESSSPRSISRHRTTTITGRIDSQIDVVSLLKAAQALASDRDPGSLVARMLRLLAENAGAQRAVLVLSQGEKLVVQAELVVEPERFTLHRSELSASAALLPATVVQYVARGHEPLVLGREGGDGRFEDDPYLAHHRPASMLLVPLSHQGRLLGVMVLEHGAVAGAFPEGRVQVVTLLAAQAATAVENAALYTELSSSHQRLEHLVEERTAELKAAKEAADAASHAKSDFLASMSHELRTPLNGILGYAQILERAADLPPEHEGAVQVIRSSGEHLLTLINDVLDLSKIEAGKLELQPRPMRFSSLVRTVLGICQVRAEQKGLSFRLEQEGAAPLVVLSDQKRLTQVLLNLLGNAIKFTERGGVVLRIQAGEAPSSGPRRVRFRVEDTGPGIAPDHMAQIFEPFEQVGAARVRAEGTGLGLSISKRIVEQMGGSLRVESELGRGSVFEMDLPLVEVSGAPSGQPSPRWERVTGYEGARRTLLVVDDRADNRAVVRGLLAPLGVHVLEASRGEEALSLSLSHRPDVIVMDLGMEGMDGYETTRRLRQIPELAAIPVIASSASASERERRQSAFVGCIDFLPKPIQIGALLSMLEAHLGISWVRAETAPPPAETALASAAAATEAERPPAEVLARLLDLADRGRVKSLLDEIERLQREGARFALFFDELRALAKGFQLQKIRAFLRAAGG